MVSIITACSRPQNLKEIYKSIKFSQIDTWYIVYDTSKCRTYEFQFLLEPKIVELMCDKPGFAGHPQINYALDLIKDGFVYIMDDDNIFHSTFWTLLPTLDKDTIYTWDQNRIQENRILKGDTIEERKIDTSQFIVPRQFIGSIRWTVNKYAGDFRFIKQIFKKYKDKFIYIPKVACYHNYIKKVNLAICFFGLTRSLKFTLPTIEEYIFGPLKNHGIKYQTYLHTYKINEPYTNPRAGESDVVLDTNEYKLLNPDFHMIEDKDMVSKKLDLEKYRTKGNPWGYERDAIEGDFTTLDNHILYLWSQKQLMQMVTKNKHNYTHIILCRPDVLYQIPIEISWFSFTSNKICIPNFGLYPNMNDRFALGRPREMLLYGNRFNEALAFSKIKSLHSETFLISTLKKHKIKYEYVNFYFTRIRANMKKDKADTLQIKKLTRRKRSRQRGTRKRFNTYIYIP